MSVAHRPSTYRYDQGCRCAGCREAKRVVHKQWRDRARAELRPSYLRELEDARALKTARRGTCEDCGAETRYNGHTENGPSRYCHPCAAKRVGLEKQGTGPFQQRLYALLERGPSRYQDIRIGLGMKSSNDLSPRLDRELKAGRIVRVSRGVYALPEEAA